MTDKATFKERVRARQAVVTSEAYAEARNILLAYPMPSPDEIETADLLTAEYTDNLAKLGLHDRAVSTALVRNMGVHTGPGPDCYELTVPDRFGTPGPDGKIALIARPELYQGQPALAIECVGITQGHGKDDGAWRTSLGAELAERGWRHDTVGGGTPKWRLHISYKSGNPLDPAHIEVSDGKGYLLFAGVALLPPSWCVRARLDPVGVPVITGPLTDGLFPEHFTDGQVDEMMGIGVLIGARMLVATDTPRPAGAHTQPPGSDNPLGSWGYGKMEPGDEIPLDLIVQAAISGCVDDEISEHGEMLFETLDARGPASWREAASLLIRYLMSSRTQAIGPEAAEQHLATVLFVPDMPAHATFNIAFAAALCDGVDSALVVLDQVEAPVMVGATKYMFATAVILSGFPPDQRDTLLGDLLAGVR